jgi:NADPH-dependent 2,4-dienoyl-CoA reductase/sulfur reductase-like enzyme/rhodanese-related sulfurtransferase
MELIDRSIIVIIGGVAGGASAAAKARRTDEKSEILVYEKGPYVSFANCGLPYYIGGDIKERDALLIQSPESFWKRFRVKVHVLHEVLRIDRAGKQVEVKDLGTGKLFFQRYDKLILSPGAGAIVPDFPGLPAKNVFIVKTVPDSDAIKNWITDQHPRRAVVVGAGFIGLETAEALKRRGLEVTVVELLPQVLPPFDPDMAAFVAHQLESQGVRLILADGIKAFRGSPAVDTVLLQSGREVPADMVILSIGVRPELKLAQDAGLAIGQAGGIAVNDHQQTSDPDIYAAGDAVEVLHGVTGRKTRISLAGPANKEGRVAGDNAAGGHLTYTGAVGTAIVESMGITAAKTGLSEREATQSGIPYFVSQTHSLDHAGYYPGSELMHMKLVIEKESGRLLGAQIVGEHGVDKRIDVLATALYAKLKVTDLENLDLAYAPQFSSAKDPVIMAGFVASNLVRHDVAAITCAELQERLSSGEEWQVVDVRSAAEFAAEHLPQARLLPIDELREHLSELDSTKPTAVYCRVGFRGYLAARILQQHGFTKVYNVSGGLLSCPQHPAPAVIRNGDGSVSVSMFHQALGTPQAIGVDVREAGEYAYERIDGTRNIPLSNLSGNVNDLPRDRELFVVCQSGVRSEQAVEILKQAGYPRIHAVVGGLENWKAAGYPVIRSKGPLPIMRQVQIAAGSLALIGGSVPGGHWLAALVGAGLLFAGISGTCGMAMFLSKMPWNKRFPTAKQNGGGGGETCSPRLL